MKRISVIFFLLFSLCGGSSETATVEDTTTTSTLNAELSNENFKKAWEENLTEPIKLSNEEQVKTNQLIELWDWKGDKTSKDEYLWEIEVNGYTCTRIWNSMGYAWITEIHPIENDYSIQHTYKCGAEEERIWLYGVPFFYQQHWWIYQKVEFVWPENCDEPCGTFVQNIAKRFKIENPQNLFEEVPILNIEITNCPSDVVDIEIGESFKIEFFVQAGSSDVTSIFYYFELNGEYYSRLPLDKENHSDYFDFPTWHNITESATFVEKQADGDVYYIYIDVFDDELNSVSTECEVKF